MGTRRNTNLLIAGFLLFQLLYPIRGLTENKFETWGEFTWNMYSQTYECWTRYLLVAQSGAPQELKVQRYFAVPSRYSHVLNLENLPAFHQFVCAENARDGKPSRILAQVSCLKNKVERHSLARKNQDICTADNHAVALE